MPPKKAKDETSNTKTDRDSNNPNLKLQSTPDIQVQNTKFDGIVLLSPAAQQLQKDLDSAIKDNISSTTKQKHGAINHLQMRELMDPDKGVNELEENLVNNTGCYAYSEFLRDGSCFFVQNAGHFTNPRRWLFL